MQVHVCKTDHPKETKQKWYSFSLYNTVCKQSMKFSLLLIDSVTTIIGPKLQIDEQSSTELYMYNLNSTQKFRSIQKDITENYFEIS